MALHGSLLSISGCSLAFFSQCAAYSEFLLCLFCSLPICSTAQIAALPVSRLVVWKQNSRLWALQWAEWQQQDGAYQTASCSCSWWPISKQIEEAIVKANSILQAATSSHCIWVWCLYLSGWLSLLIFMLIFTASIDIYHKHSLGRDFWLIHASNKSCI